MAQFDPADDLERVARRVRRLAGRLTGILEELEAVELELAAMRKAARAISGAGRTRNGGRSALSELKKAAVIEAALKRAAQTGIAAIEIKRRPDGSAVAVIDGKHLDLPRALADVLEVLLAEATAGGGAVPYRELSARLAQKSGQPLTPHATAQRVWRLRNKKFLEAGLSPFLIQESGCGIRLLLRRRGCPQRAAV